MPIIMKGLYISFLLTLLFPALDSAAQKRPVGYVDPSVIEQARQKAGTSYEEWAATEESLTLLNNEEGLVPVQEVLPGRIAAVSIVSNEEFQASKEMKDVHFNTFLDHISNYTPASLFLLPNDTTTVVFGEVIASLERFPMVIVGLHTDSRAWADNYGISPQALLFIEQLRASHQVVLAYFGNVQGLGNFDGYGPLVWAPSDNEAARSLSPQLIFGAFPAHGKLPAGVGEVFEAGAGDTTEAINRLKYTLPGELGINPRDLDEIDSIVTEGIRAKAFPGAVVMAAREGKVFYWKAFGHHEYGMEKTWLPTSKNDVFDLASITKVAATLVATMDLQEEGKIDLDEKFGTYIPAAAATDKKEILIKEILTHQAGLIPFIRFWVPALETQGVFSSDSSANHPYRVAEGMYIQKDYFKEVMWKEMLETPLRSRGEYVYSDLSMYFMRAVVEEVAGERIDHYLSREFYRPLGLSTMGFLPRYRLPLTQLVPTENDTYFRMQLLLGDVHDQGAAMAGGISGHAGLFSNSNDLMVIGQMLLNGGLYGGRQYLESETVELFNTPPYKDNRRGLGFDKPRPDPSSALMKAGVSPETFGHTGFTGTCIWVDPESDIVYIFLSNRVNPSADNWKYNEMEIRPRIQKVIYNSFK
ncbi:CubicO group peptidase (beta-lactamase class C family) [Anseongella ginsenosidimutans]|uniref:CubicO group peptidase (Beta-lactamase class C family) n=2 Tax=Anseongella ginsenosidimutans TaxID=496056 RepID=A0A4R3KSZ9_9SPHI|nr:CubicO group peptidase (beta-lactamase class C family) [Anseongella ginsenosidimutans]